MSDSYRKTPIFPHARCHSERTDKQRWHRRWRVLERMALRRASLEALEAHALLSQHQVSDPFYMGKDGRSWFMAKRQLVVATAIANRRTNDALEREVLREKILHRWASK